MEFMGTPVWLFVVMMAASVLTGLIIRHWLDRRKARLAHEHAIRLKEERKLAKRAQKRARKASKKQKDSKKSKTESEADSASGESISDTPS
ncbi:MAG: hypothetical protein LUC93_02125 [Planctomycetaceae bacterium]|nr:hypothetical protein [Planctomycetaceae bacterium]